MINGRVSSGTILQQVISNFGVTLYKRADCIEWIADCIESIGYHTGFVNKFELIPVTNCTIEQPCDYQSINLMLLPNGRKLRRGGPLNNHKELPVYGDFVSDIYSLIEAKAYLQSTDINEYIEIMDGHVSITRNREEYMNELNEKIYKRFSLINSASIDTDRHYYYYDDVSCWKTNYEGSVILFYKAIPVDKEGYPLAVDEINYKMAIRWWILKCLMESGFQHPTLKYENVFMLANDYVAKASNYGAKFTREQKEAFINHWSTGIQDRKSYYEN